MKFQWRKEEEEGVELNNGEFMGAGIERFLDFFLFYLIFFLFLGKLTLKNKRRKENAVTNGKKS